MNEPVNNGLQNGAQSNEPINNNPQMQAPQMNEPNINGTQTQETQINNNVQPNISMMNSTQSINEPQIEPTPMNNIPSMNNIPPINNVSKEQKQPNKKLLIGLFIGIVAIVVALITCTVLLASPKKVFTTAIDKMFASADEIKGKDIKTVSGSYSLDVNLKDEDNNLGIDSEIIDLINDIDFELNYGFDYENEIINFDLDSNYKNNELLNVDLIAKDDKAYILLEDIFDKYLSTDIDGLKEIFENKDLMDDTNKIITEIEKALKDALKDDYFQSKNETIKLDGKDVKVTKNILVLNDKNLEKIVKDIAKTLNNDNFVKSLAKLTNQETKTIKDTLKDVEDNEFGSFDEKIYISIYTKGMMKDAVGFEIKVEDNKLTVLEDTKNNFKYTFNMDGEKITGTAKIVEKDNTINMDMTTKYEGIEIVLKISTSTKYNEKIKDVNIKNSVDIEELTVEDENEITSNLSKNEALADLIETISTIFGSTQSEYEYDYDYSYDDSDYYTNDDEYDWDYDYDYDSDYYTNDSTYDFDTSYSY